MNKKKEILLRGEGTHQHALVGEFEFMGSFMFSFEKDEAPSIDVYETCTLVHEKPDGAPGEHNTLEVEEGEYQMGKQVEYNPFTGKMSDVWD